MLNPKQWNYVNLGLKDRFKGIYCYQKGKRYIVLVDSSQCQTMSLYGLKFDDEQKAEYFMNCNMYYDKYEFDVLLHNKSIMIEPRTIKGILEIDCGKNEEMAKKVVRTLRLQFINHLNKQKQAEKSEKKDFKGMEF
ncbi:MAG: hypothetical protein ACLRFE_02725 [Clostridia bacterium]